jgi:hypothetical protein
MPFSQSNYKNLLFYFLKYTLLLLVKAKLIIDVVFASIAFKTIGQSQTDGYEIKVFINFNFKHFDNNLVNNNKNI